MSFTSGNFMLIVSILLMAGIFIQKPGYRFGVPTLLLFLLVGMAFGCDGFGVQFDSIKDAQFIGMICLSIILFNGGLGTRIKDIHPVLTPGTVLATLGVLLTSLLTGVFVWWISGFSWTTIHFALLPSILLASTMSSTDSASVFGILGAQKVGLKHNLRPLLELESGANDPVAFLLTTMLVNVLSTGDAFEPLQLLKMFIVQFAVGLMLGFGFGRLGVWMLNHLKLDNRALYPILLVAICFLTYSLTESAEGNACLAIYIAGVVIGNSDVTHRRNSLTFVDGLSWLSQIVMFMMLGLLVNPKEMLGEAWMALLIALFMIFVARPASVFACLLPYKSFPFKAKLFTSWVGLRGAVPILFATYPVLAGVEDNYTIFNIVFFITLLSLLLQGTTIKLLANKLKLTEPIENDVTDFGVELPEEFDSTLRELDITPEMLTQGKKLSKIKFNPGELVIMIKRGEKELIPNGQLELQPDDRLLVISTPTDPT